MTDSRTLLAEYCENGTESAFRDLVARYIDLVYSTALRQVRGDAHLAQDIAQTVFLHLARKARSLPDDVMLGGWLYQATCNVAATVVRSERRRQRRERQAVEMNALQNDSPARLDKIGPILDDAIRRLPNDDRAAVLLRFFEKQDFRSLGEAIGTSEDAARMRVNRALEKLQVFLKQRGVTVTAAVLGAALASDTIVPSGLAATLATNALAAASTGGIAALTKFMGISNMKYCAVSAVVIAALTTSLVGQHKSAAHLREQNRALQQQLWALRAADDQAANAIIDNNELETLRRDQSELLRLRAEITALRKAQKAAVPPTASIGQTNTGASVSETAPLVTRLQASVHAQIGTGQSLLTGGWTNESGSRIYVMATPRVQGDNADQVGIKTAVFEVPGDALAKVGLDAFKADGTESSLQQVFEADQANLLMKQLKDTDGARLIAQTSLLTTDGREAQIQTTDVQLDGKTHSPGPTIDIVPVISSDKSAIEITLQAGLNR